MKHLYLDIEIKTDGKFRWDVAPIGTKWSWEKYEYHTDELVYDQRDKPGDVTLIISRYKAVVQGFFDNIAGCYVEEVKAAFQKALDSDWSESFRIDQWIHSANISIRFHIDDHSDRLTRYNLWVNAEQEQFLDNIVCDVEDHKRLKPDEINKIIVERLIDAYREHIEREYDKQLNEIFVE